MSLLEDAALQSCDQVLGRQLTSACLFCDVLAWIGSGREVFYHATKTIYSVLGGSDHSRQQQPWQQHGARFRQQQQCVRQQACQTQEEEEASQHRSQEVWRYVMWFIVMWCNSVMITVLDSPVAVGPLIFVCVNVENGQNSCKRRSQAESVRGCGIHFLSIELRKIVRKYEETTQRHKIFVWRSLSFCKLEAP